MFQIMAGIAVNLLEGAVSQIQFVRVKPNNLGWLELGKGLIGTKTLRLLQLNNCDLS